MKKTFQIVLEAEPEGGYTVLVPALPGCVTYGKDLEEARTMAREAISLYLEDLITEGEALPQTDTSLLGSVEVTLEAAHA
ncbi:MAG: type II toxin-antitoxin system HicB family antitoxin [Minisyncoccia bacterium]